MRFLMSGHTPRVGSTRLVVLALSLVATLAACSGGAGTQGALPSTVSVQSSTQLQPMSAASVASESAKDQAFEETTTPRVPAEGMYNSCEIDTALTTMCEQEDAAMASDGFKWEINYIGLNAFKTGPESLQAWFTYDASIGLGQIISLKAAINDPVNVLTGTSLLRNYTSSLATSCGATNNEQIIACIVS